MLEARESWLSQIPRNLWPDDNKCEQLEKIRRRHLISNDVFIDIFLSSHAITRRVQENIYSKAKEQMLDASEKDILEAVFRSRIFPRNPAGMKLTEEELRQEMQTIYTLEDLIKRIFELEKEEPRFIRDIFHIGKKVSSKIDRVLST